MPTYEYECENCGRFEKFQKITAPALESCPQCAGQVHRLISKNGGIIFKGSGFYVTDHPRTNAKADSGGAAKSSVSSGAGASSSESASA